MLVPVSYRKFLCSALMLILIIAVSAQASYLWPLPASKELTSNFCAYRAGHYHAGIDIRTFGETGYDVVAIEDGFLLRVASNWWGYGNVAYLELDDGNIAVYAHLSSFAPQIEKYVRENQRKAGRFKVNLFPERDLFHFEKGDLVGKSGQSGVGAPHLHFEIRTPDNRPINPLTYYPQVRDGRAPELEEITFRPLGGEGFAAGECRPLTFKFIYDKRRNEYILDATPLVSGKIGIEVKAVDYRNDTGRKYDIFALRFFLADSLVFESRYDTLSFDTWHLVDLDYNHYQRIESKSYYHNIYYPDLRKSESQNPDPHCHSCRALPLGDSLEPGIYAARIEAYDANGNKATSYFQIRIVPRIELWHNVHGQPESSADFVSNLGSYGYMCPVESSFSANIKIYDPKLDQFLPAGKLESIKQSDQNKPNLPLQKIYDLVKAADLPYYMLRLDFVCNNEIISSSLLGLSSQPQKRYLSQELIANVDFIDGVEFVSSYPRVVIKAKQLYNYLMINGFRANFSQPLEMSEGLTFPLALERPFEEFAFGEGFSPLINHLALEKLLTEGYRLHKMGRESKFEENGRRLVIPADVPSNIFFKLETAGIDVNDGVDEIRIYPDDRLFLEKIDIAMQNPPQYPEMKTALYGISREGRPNFAGNARDSSGYIGGQSRSFGTYRLIVDTIPPTISNIRPADGSKINTAYPRISFRMDDNLSGFDSDTLLIVDLDGEYLVCEYDPDTKIVRAFLNQGLKAGNHEFKIKAKDRLGNLTAQKSRFIYIPK